MEPRLDCRHYLGEKPCKFKRLCADCPHYAPMGVRILVLKLGAMGDALRTTPILKALRRKYQCCWIVWVTDRESYPILENNPLIDCLLINEPGTVQPLLAQEFDCVICLDKDPSVTALAMQVNARKRLGFAMSPYGTLDVFNEASRYSLALGLDDHLKFFENSRTYQEIIHEMIELPYEGDEYVFALQDDDRQEASRILSENIAPGNGPRIGLNTGCGDVFATKKWPTEHFITLTARIRDALDGQVFLLGGTSEAEENHAIEDAVAGQAVSTGHHSLGVFAGLLSNMDAVVASDTMALHLALAVGTPVIGLFGPTCAQEIDFYNRGEAVIVTCDCSPCYRKTCPREKSCMYALSPETVLDALQKNILT